MRLMGWLLVIIVIAAIVFAIVWIRNIKKDPIDKS